MDVVIGLEQVGDGDCSEDDVEQHAAGKVPGAPWRRHIGRIDQVLRGKLPGLPG